MSYYHNGKDIPSRAISFVVVIALHIAVIYAFCLANTITLSRVSTIIHAQFIPVEHQKIIPLPAVPDVVVPPSPVINVPAPEVKVALTPIVAPVQNVIEDANDTVYENDAPLGTAPSGPSTKPQPISGKHGIESYPSESMRAKEAGRTVLEMCISPTGIVDSVRVSKTSGYPRLDQAAIKMAKEYRFKPALRNGKAVATCVNYGISFSLGYSQATGRAQPSIHAARIYSEESSLQGVRNPAIGPVLTPVTMQTYLDALKRSSVDCNPRQLRVIGQEITDKRYVIEAQCVEQPQGLVAFMPLADNPGKFEIMDCLAAAKRQITCEFAIREE